MAIKPMTTVRSAVAALLGLALFGCGGSQQNTVAFSGEWQNDGGSSIERVYQRVKGSTLPVGADVALGVTSTGISGLPLDGRAKWSLKHALDSRPIITGDVVVIGGGGELVGLDAASGKQLWSRPGNNQRLRGAGDNGQVTALSLGGDGPTQNQLLVVDRAGKSLLEIAPTVQIGVPAVLGDVVFVPWGNQYVSAIEIGSGKEIGRLLARAQVSQALNIGGSLYFGERGLIRFDEKIAESARNDANFVSFPERELPGKPLWFQNGARVAPAVAIAEDKIRFYARPSGTSRATESSRFVASYFRLGIGFNFADGAVRWVKSFPGDVIGGAAGQNGFAFCDETGTISLVDAQAGSTTSTFSFGEPLKGCVVQAGKLTVSGGEAMKPLVDQISAVVTLEAPQLVTAQRFLLRELGTHEEPEVTKTLIDLARSPRTAPILLEEARTQLAARRNGADYMLEALASHYDFLAGELRVPPVGPLADALAAIGEPRAAGMLADHLNDPADSSDDVARAARALVKLGTSAEYDRIKTFFTLYRATANDEKLVEAVIASAKAMIRVGGDEAEEVVLRAANDPLTEAEVRKGIQNLTKG
jgi:outer membrane protein assembly factor BamB